MRLLYYPSVPDTLAPDEDDIRAGVSSCSVLIIPTFRLKMLHNRLTVITAL